MTQSEMNELDPVLKEARARLLARVYSIILSPDWGEPDEPVNLPGRRRRPPKQKQSDGE
jgi:hypothetical protein